MNPDNISSVINRFSGWSSNEPLKTDKDLTTLPTTVQAIKIIAAILDPHRITVGIDTLYTPQRKSFTSESQQLIESALKTLHVINPNNLETNHDEKGNYLALEYNIDTPEKIAISVYNDKIYDSYGQCLLFSDDEINLFNLIQTIIFETKHQYVINLMLNPELMFKFICTTQQSRLDPQFLVPNYFPVKIKEFVTEKEIQTLFHFLQMKIDFNILTLEEYTEIMRPLLKCERSIHDSCRYITGNDSMSQIEPPSGNQIHFHLYPDESVTLFLYFSNNTFEHFIFNKSIPNQYRYFAMFTNIAIVIDQLTDATKIL